MHPTSAGSAAAPGDAQDARHPSATNDKAPVTPRRGAAVERAEPMKGSPASVNGFAGIAGPPARAARTPGGRK